ncbi:unnamed protein product [Lactuca saligna]|uniref:Methionyl/Leucyl tRNA synthetase domain-containing protein n=1 Tax=Lactuca saligna TaxID=75948 RepID=A0AA36E3J8_LACSI|nr:unnamed protein product [Lactuca saligna]
MSVVGSWSQNTTQEANAWLKTRLKQRCITRDFKWGVLVPHERFNDKVFYVWFDAPIGYVSITSCYTPEWEKWWKNPENVELYQFMGKDNVPFHTVMFHSRLLGTSENWRAPSPVTASRWLRVASTTLPTILIIGVGSIASILMPRECVMQGKVASVMCSYNQVNEIPTCHDPRLLHDTIHGAWGLNGYIVLDCDSVGVFFDNQHYTATPEDVDADEIKAGLDLDCCPFLGIHTQGAMDRGLLKEIDVDSALVNTLIVQMRLRMFDGSGDDVFEKAKRPSEMIPSGHGIRTPVPLFRELRDEEVELLRERHSKLIQIRIHMILKLLKDSRQVFDPSLENKR